MAILSPKRASFFSEFPHKPKYLPWSDPTSKELASRIVYAIHAGDFYQEFAERAEAFLRARGIDPHAKFPKEKKGAEIR
jgi:hypothetical protein